MRTTFRRIPLVLVAVLTASLFTLIRPAAAAGEDATLFAFGAAPHRGSTDGLRLEQPLTGMAPTRSGEGYWLTTADGAVYSFGDAPFHGSLGHLRPAKPIVGMATTPSGNGYWLVASDGGIFTFGDAPFLGSTGALKLNQPIIGMAATVVDGQIGYWLVARDGGIFTFGAAPFRGSTGGIRLNQPIVGMAAAPGNGYWLVAGDGGIFAFGAPFHGSTGGITLNRPVTAMAATPSGNGYWLSGADGGVFTFGDATFSGSAAGRVAIGKQVLSMAASPSGGYWLLTGRPLLILGAMGPGVEGMQRRLNELGYWGPIDGRFGTLTTQQIYAFQKAMHLPRDGVLNAEEMSLLERAGRPTARSTTGYTVEIDKTRQLILVVRDGFVEWAFNTSTGNGATYSSGGGTARAITPEGRFRIYNQINGLRISELGQLWRPKYFSGGYAMHGSPSIPPYPASHGCARLSNAAINFIWEAGLIPMGTPVWVYS